MTYVYSCKNCGKIFEVSGTFAVVLQNHDCPECKSKDTQKMITAPNIHYKGKGWTRKDEDRIE